MHTQQLQTLLDKEAIRELNLNYCRAIDRRDFTALKALYHPDATDDHGSMYQGPASGYIDALPQIMSVMEVVWHMTGNMLIEVDGNRAEGEIYTWSYHRADLGEGAQDLIVGGRYLDHYIKEDGKWFFYRRKIVMDWNQIGVSKCDWQSALFQGTPRGAAPPHDPSNSYFQLIT